MTTGGQAVLASSIQAQGQWKEVAHREFEAFRRKHPSVEVEGTRVSLTPPAPTSYGPPADYQPERTTHWSFPDRGDWATHRGNYRGNWSPYIPRNLLLKYTTPGDVVVDPMAGSGTTLVEARLLGRNAIGLDINPDAAMVARSRLTFDLPPDQVLQPSEVRTFVGDARDLSPLADASIDLIATHPPYANIIQYTRNQVEGDLSSMAFPDFLKGMEAVAAEAYRVLKPGRHCGILAGDTRKRRHYVPVSLGILNAFLSAGFVLKEDVIKAQHKMKTTREQWRGKYDFYLLAHEHLYIFRKPESGESTSPFAWSKKWW